MRKRIIITAKLCVKYWIAWGTEVKTQKVTEFRVYRNKLLTEFLTINQTPKKRGSILPYWFYFGSKSS